MGACDDNFKNLKFHLFIYASCCCHFEGLIINNKTMPWGWALLLLSGFELLCAAWCVCLLASGGDRVHLVRLKLVEVDRKLINSEARD